MSLHRSAQADSGVPGKGIPRVVVVTTVMLTFISFWRAAALVLNDLASTGYYIGGIAEHAIGPAAPYFILLVMLFSTCVRAVYVESCSMFVRGGVYRIVKEAMGSTMAKIAVSALVFDFVLTGPISSVSGGHYVYGFLENVLKQLGIHLPETVVVLGSSVNLSNAVAVVLAIGVTVYFWRLNIRGIEESSDRALKIMLLTAVMVVIMLTWAGITIVMRNASLPPMHIKMNEESLGWLHNFQGLISAIPLAVFFVCFGHTLLAMSGEEALAQVYREIEAPKHKNLIRAAIVIFVFSLLFTGFSNMAAAMIVPEAERLAAGDNLLNALVLHLAGPHILRLFMVAFVVFVGALILAGAVNTSIFAANGVLNRVAEDGILADWFRSPHRRFGTTHNIINLIGVLQVVTILASRGDITLLGEAYAFGVVWSFAFMSLSMFILRFRYKGPRAFKVPLNITVKGMEIPVGVGLVCILLTGVAVTNLFTKKIATVSGICFTASFFALFTLSDWFNKRRRQSDALEHREKFMLERRTELSEQSLPAPDGRRRLLIPIRDPNNLSHLKATLEKSHDHKTELVVMTVKVDRNYRENAGAATYAGDQPFDEGTSIFTPDEERLFTRVVELAEKYGEQIVPIVVPSNNSWFAIARTAKEIGADEIVLGISGKVPSDVQLEQLAVMWAMVATGTEKPLTLTISGGRADQEITATI